jgi:hypothetical protein
MQQRIEAAILPHLEPVTPLPGTPVLALRLLAACAIASTLAVAIKGTAGIRTMAPVEAALILGSLGAVGIAAAIAISRLMVPASRNVGVMRIAGTLLALPPLFIWTMIEVAEHPSFATKVATCFSLGLTSAVFAGALILPQVRRGAVLRATAAGLLIGCLSAFAAVAFQEIYCPIIDVRHKTLAHLSNFAVCAGLGLLLRRWVGLRGPA